VNGELVFEAPWQGRAFGLCVAVLEREGLTWADFRTHLVAAIEREPEAAYYDHFATALAELLVARGLVALADLPA
jgi:nitrile hydratase accessory protein